MIDAGALHARLQIHDRTALDGPPRGHTVSCPNKGWVSIVRCFECAELADLSFDRATCTSYVECTPPGEAARREARPPRDG